MTGWISILIAFLVAGQYTLRVYAKKIDEGTATELAVVPLQISDAQALELRQDGAGIYFDWGPDQQAHQAHIETKPPDALDQILRHLPPLSKKAASS